LVSPLTVPVRASGPTEAVWAVGSVGLAEVITYPVIGEPFGGAASNRTLASASPGEAAGAGGAPGGLGVPQLAVAVPVAKL
jgi:hypothetical protein